MVRCLYFLFIVIFVLAGCQEKDKIQVREFSKIVFLSNREAQKGRYDIFMMNPDGSDPKNLTPNLNSLNTLSQPQISPDGKNIIFTSVTDKRRLQLLNIKKQEITTVLELPSLDDIQYSFSPKSDKITYILKIGNKRQIHIINTDGSNKNNISNPAYNEFHPSFSPDGSQVICVTKQNSHHAITIMNVDGSERKDLYQHRDEISYPTMSPDGDYIAFIAYEKNKAGLFIMHNDGSDIRQVTKDDVVVAKPQFTPDLSKLVFVHRARGRKNTDIGIIDIDGANFKNLTDGLNLFNQLPQIIPSGKSIVFQSVKLKGCDIYSVNIDGSNLINLTNHPKLDQYPSL